MNSSLAFSRDASLGRLCFDNSLAEYLTSSLGDEDEYDISPPKTPDYCRNDEKYDHEINVFNEKNDNQKPLQADREVPIYALRLVAPTRRKIWFH